MKKVFFSAAFMLLAASCSNDESFDSSINPSNEQVVAPVTVTTTTGFDISQGEFTGTRATEPVATYGYINALTLAFYKISDGTEVYKYTQFRNDPSTFTTFGEFSTSLPIGNYTMVVLGYGQGVEAQEITLTSPVAATYGEGRVRETFAETQTVNIANTNAVNLEATLSRIVSALSVQSTDVRPAEVTHMRLTYTGGGKAFSPTSGLATKNTGFVDLIDYATAPGTTTSSGGYLFLATDEQSMDVTIETLNADGVVLFSHTVTGVPLKRNRVTTLTGAVYNISAATTAGAFQVNSDWIETHNINF